MPHINERGTVSLLAVLLLSLFFLQSCQSDGDNYINAVNLVAPNTHYISIGGFPADLSLEEGHKLVITNLDVGITFAGAETYSDGDAKIMLEIEYLDGKSSVDLYMNSSPHTYNFENGTHYKITPKKLSMDGGAYQLSFTINQYFLLKRPQNY